MSKYVLDYHLHLWPHGSRTTTVTVDDVASWCEKASSRSVPEIAITEHLFRFKQAKGLLDSVCKSDPSPRLQSNMARYFENHATADLDGYVTTLHQARAAGLAVRVGLEVDYYRGHMTEVANILDGYPFDVLLGSIHWLGAWRFDDIDDPDSIAEWNAREVDSVWNDYTQAVIELAESGVCDVLSHPDLAKVMGNLPTSCEDSWQRIAEALRASGMAAEVSSAGWRKPVGEPYPATGLIRLLCDRGIPVTTASDAHRIDDIAYRFEDLALFAESAGCEAICAFDHRSRLLVPLRGSAHRGVGAQGISQAAGFIESDHRWTSK